MEPPPPHFVSRGGLKLQHALESFAFSPAGLTCADLGCSTGGFTDCLLKSNASHVTAVDTGYGVLAWTLRQDPRVTVRERENALYAEPPPAGVDLVVIDMSWTPQHLCIPAALRWLSPASNARIITLIKPHYEDKPLAKTHRGILPDDLAQNVAQRVIAELPALAVSVLAATQSPIRGGSGANANLEWLALLAPAVSHPAAR